jgi:PiT family inorganic phosphate transporter
MDAFTWIVILVVISLLFDFLNGFNDSANMVATLISSRSMSGRNALTMAAIADFCGPFIFGMAVAKTIGSGIAIPQFITVEMLIAALLSACIWNLITWKHGIPSSSSHALVGGLIGALLIGAGAKAIMTQGLIKIFIALLFSPVIGLFFGWVSMKLTLRLLKNATPNANYFFKWGQIPTAITLALSHGANDAQKTMGIITLGLITTGYQQEFSVPYWVMLACAGAISIGTFTGGWRIIKTMSTKFYKIKPIHSFTSQLASSVVIIASSLLGGPVSTTQVVSMSIMGVGAGERLSKVRWLVLKEIVLSWILTIPVTTVMAIPIYLIIQLLLH